MTERQCGILCNKIYAALKAKQMNGKQAARMLEQLSPHMSFAQNCKYMDFLNTLQHDPWVYGC